MTTLYSIEMSLMHRAGRIGETLGRFRPMLLPLLLALAFVQGLWTLAYIDGRLTRAIVKYRFVERYTK